MILTIWNDILYQPLFNTLIWIYNNMTTQNMGWAVVYLTIVLRIILLPLSIIQIKNEKRNEQILEEMKKVDTQFKSDQVLKKQHMRELLKRKKVNPWAKFLSLGIQGLVLVLLYQVFLQGITGERILHTLYTFIDFPGTINTMFYGFNLRTRHDILWPALVAVGIFAENYMEYRQRKLSFTKADLSYFTLFPLAIFLALWMLPMVKSLFVLTSIIFSAIFDGILGVLFRPKEDQK